MDAGDYMDAIKDCGLPDLDDTPLLDILNAAQMEVCVAKRWPFREESVTDTGPFAIADLGIVLSVVEPDSDYSLPVTSKKELEDHGYDLTTTGTPALYYMDDSLTVSTYPLGEVTVRYLKLPATLTATTDTLLVPAAHKFAVIYSAAKHGHLRVGTLDLMQQYERLAAQAIELMGAALMRPTNPVVTSTG